MSVIVQDRIDFSNLAICKFTGVWVYLDVCELAFQGMGLTLFREVCDEGGREEFLQVGPCGKSANGKSVLCFDKDSPMQIIGDKWK